jgi:hypothetical protein
MRFFGLSRVSGKGWENQLLAQKVVIMKTSGKEEGGEGAYLAPRRPGSC